MLQIKSLAGKLKAMDEEGRGLAVIATLGVIDKDGDVTLPGAFGEQAVKVVPTHDWSHVPIGKATLKEIGNEAVAEFELNLEIEAARDWHSAMKLDLESPPPLQEWSYGYTITGSSFGQFEDQDVRFLAKLQVHEISPVLLGAGVNTRTLALKEAGERPSMKLADQIGAVLTELGTVIDRCDAIKQVRAEDGRDLSLDRYADLKAVVAMLEQLAGIQAKLAAVMETGGEISPEELAATNELVARHTVTMMRLKGHKI